MFAFAEGEIVYYHPAYEQIALQYLNRPVVPAGQSYTKTWPIKQEFVPNDYKTYVGNKQVKAELRYQVLETLYAPPGEDVA